MALGPLSALSTGGTAGRFIIGVYTETSLNHHHTVMTTIHTVLIYRGEGEGERGERWRERKRKEVKRSRETMKVRERKRVKESKKWWEGE